MFLCEGGDSRGAAESVERVSWRECPVVLEREVLERYPGEIPDDGESVLERSPGREGGPSGVEREVPLVWRE